MKSKGYMEQGIDLKRLVLVLGKKLWLILAGVILGAVLGGITYKIVTNMTNGEPEYQANADYYITFNFDEFNYGADYYNAYTWDGILRDDPIVDYALTLLPEEITKDMVKAAVTGEMLGDYRILTVHVKTESKEKENCIRTINYVNVEQENNKLIITFRGDGFLRYQVRNMVGILIRVGENKISTEDVERILMSKDRTTTGKTAPPEGLYLTNVSYE